MQGEGQGEGVTATTAPTITTQYGPRPNSDFGTGILFIKTKDSEGGNTVAYYHNDHLGTPIYATDRAGLVVWSAQYNAFGAVSITTPTPAEGKPIIESNLRFPGQVEDAETGLYYNWHRYYDPELGRYVTADPIGLDGGINLYSYVGGDPVNVSDPEGLCPPCIAAARMYFKCFADCMISRLGEEVMEKDLECIDWKGDAKDCALDCLNPLNYFKVGKFGVKGKKKPKVAQKRGSNYHGNDRRNPKPQHNYDILDKNGRAVGCGEVRTASLEN